MKIGIIGLGYVGLPLSFELSKKFKVIGFDKNHEKIKKLKNNFNYVNDETFKKNKNIIFSDNPEQLKTCSTFIICVPTPVYKNNKPDIRLLISAYQIVKKFLKKDDLVISESTVYPGLTNSISKKILEKKNFKINQDFFVGYSPERINPGDKIHNIKNIYKVISSEKPQALNKMKKIYSQVTNKIYATNKIEIAEASKAIENAQRDINVAFINEVSKILIKNNIPVHEVLKAALTKWNFLNFKPGLVGGHCIGVDPYYLNHFSQKSKVQSKVIISGRKLNDSMPLYFYRLFLKKLFLNKKKKYRVLFMGVTFKENINDFRNSKSLEICKYLKKNKMIILDIFDPMINTSDLKKAEGMLVHSVLPKQKYDAFFIGSKHSQFKKLKINCFQKLSNKNSIIFDIFNFLNFNKNSNNPKYITI
jgi:UDP-N-acetyl-D-galactosamine dehydrogenase